MYNLAYVFAANVVQDKSARIYAMSAPGIGLMNEAQVWMS